MEVKEVHFLKSADEDNLKNPRWGGVEGKEVNSYIVGYMKA